MKTLLKAPLAAAGLLVFASISPNEINAFPQSWGGSQQVPGVGHEGDGAGVALYDIDNNGRLDMILMAYDDPSGSNEFRYRVGKNVDQNGRVASWSGWRRIAGMGHNGDGAGVALADLDRNGRPEMVMMVYDAPSGSNNFRYRVARNLNANGVPQSVGSSIQIGGVGNRGDGADIAIGDVDRDGRLDIVLAAYDDPSGPNNFRVRVGRSLNSSGQVTGGWSQWTRIAGMGDAGEGAGIALADLNGGGNLDLLVMAYDAPNGANGFRYRVGYDLETSGAFESWSPMLKVAGVGHKGQGAGVAIGELTNNGRPDVIFMAYDNPNGANTFRYRMGRNWDRNPPVIKLSHSPLHPGLNDMVTFTAEASDADGLNRTNILVNARLAKNCTGTVCEYTGGPYPEDVAGGYDRCRRANFSSAPINLSSLRKGAQVCVRTSSGRIGAMQLRDNIGASPGTLRLAYTVWNTPSGSNPPSLRRRATSNVRQTFSLDLDAGSSATNRRDFWFRAQTATNRSITPQNGAQFAVMKNSGTYTRANGRGSVSMGSNAFDVFGSRAWTGYRSFSVGNITAPVVPLLVTGSTRNALDVVFIRDRDSYSSTRAFLDDVEDTILNSYLADEAVAKNAHRFNFWYIRASGKTDGGCVLEAPSNFNRDASFADSGAIVHSDNFRDCARGKIFSSEPTSYRTFMHETGHALFGLRDIYCCDSSYSQNTPWSNLYSSLNNCRADARRQGWPTSRCVQLSSGSETINFWRADRNDVMGSCSGIYPSCAPGDYNFDQGSRRRVIWRMDTLQ